MLYQEDEYQGFDEGGMFSAWTNSEFDVCIEQFQYNFFNDKKILKRPKNGRVPPSYEQFYWNEGVLKNLKIGDEMMYLHFRNWKNKIWINEVNGMTESFFMTASGALKKRPSILLFIFQSLYRL